MGKASRAKRDRAPWSRDAELKDLVSRLKAHEALVEQRCPGALAELEQLRSRPEIGRDWPSWCWLPSDVVDRATRQHCRPALGEQADAGLSGAAGFVSAWRQGKGIYRVNREFAEELHATTLTDSLPGDVLLEFPEWCAYIALAPVPGIVGGYLRLDWDEEGGRPLLAMLFDFATGPGPENIVLANLDLPLDHASLSSALSELLAEDNYGSGDAGEVSTIARVARPFVDVALYLCSMDADLVGGSGTAKPRRASSQSPEPRTWEVGYRVAALLKGTGGSHAGEPAGGHPGPRPHLRRAHWHTYIVGKGSRADPSLARRVLRWVHPTLVGTGEREPVVRVVR